MNFSKYLRKTKFTDLSVRHSSVPEFMQIKKYVSDMNLVLKAGVRVTSGIKRLFLDWNGRVFFIKPTKNAAVKRKNPICHLRCYLISIS